LPLESADFRICARQASSRLCHKYTCKICGCDADSLCRLISFNLGLVLLRLKLSILFSLPTARLPMSTTHPDPVPPAVPNVPNAPTTPIVLSFAAADPTCGAGLQADLLTLAAHGCHPLTVLTAVTVQDTAGVEAVLPMAGGWVADQARALLEDMPVAAFKLGMLGSIEAVVAVAEVLSDYPDTPVVFDPVLASGRGDAFADEDIVTAMIELLLPHTDILTPNSLETRRLAQELGAPGRNIPSLPECAQRLIGTGCQHVLVTGTHEPGTSVVNTLYGSHGPLRNDAWQRLPGSYHGSGCTLASAIAAQLAHGLDMSAAVQAAQDYTWRSLAAGFRPGMGQHVPDRLWWFRRPGPLGEQPGKPSPASLKATHAHLC
jgi:hydroxymethylpyrimidine/phosphomethylpyrimidine kinase